MTAYRRGWARGAPRPRLTHYLTLPLGAARRAAVEDDGYYRGPRPYRALVAGTEWLGQLAINRVIVFDTPDGPMARAFQEHRSVPAGVRRHAGAIGAFVLALAGPAVLLLWIGRTIPGVMMPLTVMWLAGAALLALGGIGAMTLAHTLEDEQKASVALQPGTVLGVGLHAPKGHGQDLNRRLIPWLDRVTVITHPATSKVEALHRQFGFADYAPNSEVVTLIRKPRPAAT